MPSPIRIGVLGAARVATYALIDPARSNPRVSVHAVAARDPARAKAYASQHGIPEVAESYAALLGREDVDLIYNALPPSEHGRWTVAALEAGKPVLCEKPLAPTLAEAAEMVAAAHRTGGLMVEALHYRHHAVMRTLVDWLKAGRIGRLRRLEARFEIVLNPEDPIRWDPALGGGALGDLGCYCAHALRALAGEEPVVVSAKAEPRGGVDAWAEAALAFPSGAVAELRASFVAEERVANLRLEGEDGVIDVDNFLAPQLGHQVRLNGEPHVFEGPGSWAAQLDHMADVLDGRASPLIGHADSLANATVLSEIRARAGLPNG